MSIIKITRLIIIVVLIILLLLLPVLPPLPPAQVTVLPSNQTFAPDETFELAILIDPMGTNIAGAKLNLAFNRDLLKVNKITEGNLLKQNGANTFFNSGVVNNSEGTVINIFGTLLGNNNNNISNPGIFILINLTAINSSGSSGINLSKVEICDQNGVLIALNVTNGTINTKMTATVLPEILFINGTVMDSINKTGISGVTVTANSSLFTTTNESGFYSLALSADTYDLTAKFDPVYYSNNTITISTIGREVVVQDINLIKKSTGTITGSVMNS